MFIEQLEILSKENGKTLSNILKDLEINPSSATHWRKGATINSEILIKLANYFNVSTDYILGREEKGNTYIANQGEVKGNNTQNINSINEETSYLEKAILQEVKKLSKSEQIELLSNITKE